MEEREQRRVGEGGWRGVKDGGGICWQLALCILGSLPLPAVRCCCTRKELSNRICLRGGNRSTGEEPLQRRGRSVWIGDYLSLYLSPLLHVGTNILPCFQPRLSFPPGKISPLPGKLKASSMYESANLDA